MLQAKERLIFALDVPTAREALQLVGQLKNHIGCFKIGLELFVGEGPSIVRQIVKIAPVFLDLKLHDITTTVERTSAIIQNLGVEFLTVHASENDKTLQAAVETAPKVKILCITVLTDVVDDGIEEIIIKRAKIAKQAGCYGIVCSGKEIVKLRSIVGPDIKIITPGIRPVGEEANDQHRVVTPYEAIYTGADMIVVGRPIRDAKNPCKAADRIVEEIKNGCFNRRKYVSRKSL